MKYRSLICAQIFIICGIFANKAPAQTTINEQTLSNIEAAAHLTSGILLENIENKSLGVEDRPPARPLPPLAVDLVKSVEGWRPNKYLDSRGFCTIGYGHLIVNAKCPPVLNDYSEPLSFEDGTRLITKDLELAESPIQTLVKKPLNPNQFGALTSFVFNIGADHFLHSTLLIYLNDGAYELAAAEMLKWTRAGDGHPAGLKTRRICEVALFKGELKYSSDGKFHPDVCSSLGIEPLTGESIDILTGESRP